MSEKIPEGVNDGRIISSEETKINEWNIAVEPIYPGGQGITKDANHWYYSTTQIRLLGKNPVSLVREGFLWKLDLLTLKLMAWRKTPYADVGYDHIGDLDFFEGKIYASIEDVDYKKPRLVIFNQDLSVDTWCQLPQLSHFPWVAVHPETRYVYTSEFAPVDKINIYEVKPRDEANLVDQIKLSQTLYSVQGGFIHENSLILSCDDEPKAIYRVDMETGRVETMLETLILTEMEGICSENDAKILHFTNHEGQFFHATRE